jgi:fructose-1,6-bisphosphatase I
MAFINEQAGGYATNGRRNILDLSPSKLADTSPAYIGSESLAKEIEKAIGSENQR